MRDCSSFGLPGYPRLAARPQAPTSLRVADALTLGHDVDAVSGATISCRSATYAARKSLALADLLRARERKPR